MSRWRRKVENWNLSWDSTVNFFWVLQFCSTNFRVATQLPGHVFEILQQNFSPPLFHVYYFLVFLAKEKVFDDTQWKQNKFSYDTTSWKTFSLYAFCLLILFFVVRTLNNLEMLRHLKEIVLLMKLHETEVKPHDAKPSNRLFSSWASENAI